MCSSTKHVGKLSFAFVGQLLSKRFCFRHKILGGSHANAHACHATPIPSTACACASDFSFTISFLL